MRTASEVARVLGIAKSTVCRLCNENSIGVRVGKVLGLTDDDVERIKSLIRPVGNPNFGK